MREKDRQRAIDDAGTILPGRRPSQDAASMGSTATAVQRRDLLLQLQANASQAVERRREAAQREREEGQRCIQITFDAQTRRDEVERQRVTRLREENRALSVQRQHQQDAKRSASAAQREAQRAASAHYDPEACGVVPVGKAVDKQGYVIGVAQPDKADLMKKRVELQQFWLQQMRDRQTREKEDKARAVENERRALEVFAQPGGAAAAAYFGEGDSDRARRGREALQYRDAVRQQIATKQQVRTSSLHEQRDREKAELAREREELLREETKQILSKRETQAALRDAMQRQLQQQANVSRCGAQPISARRLRSATPPPPPEPAEVTVLWKCPVSGRLLPPESFNAPRQHRHVWPASTRDHVNL
mgnify:FL=1